jgi:hypothetical protein
MLAVSVHLLHIWANLTSQCLVVWNFVGAIGFTLSGAFGFSSKHGLMYQSALSTFWGSKWHDPSVRFHDPTLSPGWAFLIGSVLQWYEAVNPVSASVLSDVP